MSQNHVQSHDSQFPNPNPSISNKVWINPNSPNGRKTQLSEEEKDKYVEMGNCVFLERLAVGWHWEIGAAEYRENSD